MEIEIHDHDDGVWKIGRTINFFLHSEHVFSYFYNFQPLDTMCELFKLCMIYFGAQCSASLAMTIILRCMMDLKFTYYRWHITVIINVLGLCAIIITVLLASYTTFSISQTFVSGVCWWKVIMAVESGNDALTHDLDDWWSITFVWLLDINLFWYSELPCVNFRSIQLIVLSDTLLNRATLWCPVTEALKV